MSSNISIAVGINFRQLEDLPDVPQQYRHFAPSSPHQVLNLVSEASAQVGQRDAKRGDVVTEEKVAR